MDDKTLAYIGERVDRARKIKGSLHKIDELADLTVNMISFNIYVVSRDKLNRAGDCKVSDLMEISVEAMQEFLETQIAQQYAVLTKELDEL